MLARTVKCRSRRFFRPCIELLESRRVMAAAVDLTFSTNGSDANASPGPSIKYSDPVSWSYQVANIGTLPLTNVAVIDDNGTPSNPSDDFSPPPVFGQNDARGTVEKTLNLSVGQFLVDPTLSYIYASLPASGQVAVINTETLQQQVLISVGGSPTGMALSLDGSRLYVACGSSIGVIDTATLTALPSISVAAYDVEVGADGRLFVLGASYSAIYQINPATGQSAGPNITSAFVYGGELAISPSKDRLYYADTGLSPATLYQFDVTTSPPKLVWQSPRDNTQGSNGQDLAISSDGSMISFACGYGQGGYRIAKYRTSDMASLGTFDTDAYPREITFSTDGAVTYTVHTSGQIDTWDTKTFLSLGTIATIGEANQLVVDRTSGLLFAAIGSQLKVYSTGRGGSINTGDTNRNNVLDPGETWIYAAQGLALAGQQAKSAKVTARDPQNNTVSDQDASFYLGLAWQIDVEGAANGLDADQPSGPTIRAGDQVALTYTLKNPGLYSLTNIVVSDDHGTPNNASDDFQPTFVSGDTDRDGLLDPGETWLYSATVAAMADVIAEHVAAVGLAVDAQNNPLPSTQTSDDDVTYYLGGVSSIVVKTTVNGADASASPGPNVPPASSLTLGYQVTNTGNLPVSNVALSDNAGTPNDPSDDFSPTSVLAPPLALGSLEATYDFGASRFLMDPQRPYMYVTAYSANSVAIINTRTLQQETLIFVGSGPAGMALSNDGSRLYVANGNSNELAVIDLQSRTALPSITLSQHPHDVEVGADGRLYVLGDSYGSIMQIDPLTGASAGPDITAAFIYSGQLEISPSKDRLYYADYGLSPASLYQFDITVSPPKLLWESPHGGTSGYNGQDLAISHDGTFISYACGAGQTGYDIAKYRTSDMSILGSFNTGPYPREITFSPDDAIAYTVHFSGLIDVWNTSSFASLGAISASDEAYELAVDASGTHLFAAYDSQLRVFATGQPSNTNIGDVNRNHLLDPGETWSYQATALAHANDYSGAVNATATDALSGPLSAASAMYYVGVVPVTRISVPENICDLLIGHLTTAAGPLVPSDSRFEVIDSNLWLKATGFLTFDADDGLVVNLSNATSPPIVAQQFVITVTRNPTPWRHEQMPLDVTGDNQIAPNDALEIINDGNAFGFRQLGPRPASKEFFDVTGDGWIAPDDVVAVINFINAFGSAPGHGEGEVAAADLYYLQLGESADLMTSIARPRARRPY